MKRIGPILFLLVGCAHLAWGQTDGIFADFSTSMGNFTVWLDASNAPRAVASFVGLATGEGSWTDPPGNVWQKPFYRNSIFHRVVKDSNTNGTAIQGGGFPWGTASIRDQPVGVSTSIYAGQLTVTNPPGVATNILNLPVVTTNAAAVPTTYVLNGATLTTNAPMKTLTWIEASVTSSNAQMGSFTNIATTNAGFTNYSLSVHVTTNVCQVAVVITNGSGTNADTVHAIEVQSVSSNLLWAPTVLTNFLDAGYDMLESVTNGLIHSNGVISMANSGPNTDGSQFFITATNVPSWDGSYTVFGHVVTGLDVVASIAAVPVQGTGLRPVVDVVLNNVAIRREGDAATNFNIASHGVPVAESGPMGLSSSGTNIQLVYEIASQTKMNFRESPDLQTWTSEDGGFFIGDTFTWTTLVSQATYGDRFFFHLSRIRHPEPVTSPATQRGRTFTFWWNEIPLKYEATFHTNMLGGYAWATQDTNAPFYHTIFSIDKWTRQAYSARLYFVDNTSGGIEYEYFLGFDPGRSTNRFMGSFRNFGAGPWTPITGTFTLQ